MKELEQKVYDFFIEHYNTKFNGIVKINKIEDMYECTLELNEQWFVPTYIMLQTDNDDDFIKYLLKEIRSRNLIINDASKFTSIKLRADQL